MRWVTVLLSLDRSTLRIVEDEVRDHLASTVPNRLLVTDGFGELSLLMLLRMGLSVSQLAAQLGVNPPRAGSPGSLCLKAGLKASIPSFLNYTSFIFLGFSG